jgi:hypothetical protein
MSVALIGRIRDALGPENVEGGDAPRIVLHDGETVILWGEFAFAAVHDVIVGLSTSSAPDPEVFLIDAHNRVKHTRRSGLAEALAWF